MNKSVIILIVVLILCIVCMILGRSVIKINEGFTSSESKINSLENFGDEDLTEIKNSINQIRSSLTSEFPDMSKYVTKNQLTPPETCKVSNAVDKDSYISKTQAEKLGSCKVANAVDADNYILKTLANKANSCPPPIDTSKMVLKSTLPAAQKPPACICPKVSVSAGLCKKCPECPACPPPPRPEPCKCPEVQPCPPAPKCPECPPQKQCEKKVCPPCPVPKETKCKPKEIIKILKKIVYVDRDGREIRSIDETLTTPGPTQWTNNSRSGSGSGSGASSYYDADDFKKWTDAEGSDEIRNLSSGSGLATPSPLSSSSVDADSGKYSDFPAPTDKPFPESYKCQSTAFNNEFRKYGVYGDNRMMYDQYLPL
jgi:hypothetical protein